jgi:hypothetical protein
MIERVQSGLIWSSRNAEIKDDEPIESALPEKPELILPASYTRESLPESRIDIANRKLELPPEYGTDIPTLEKPVLSRAPFRNQETHTEYEKKAALKLQLGSTACDICELIDKHADTRRSKKLGRAMLKLMNMGFTIVPNEFPYDMFDGQKVLEHDLLVPLKHFSEADKVHLQTRLAFALALARAMKDYSTYSERAPNNAASSIPGHKHTHLYKLGEKMEEFHYGPDIRTIKFPSDNAPQLDG